MSVTLEIPLNYNGEISISEVLLEIEKFKTFSMAWMRASGKDKGTVKFVEEAIKGTKTSDSKTRNLPKTSTAKKWQFKKYNMIPILDKKANQMLTPKWTNIMRFNGKKVIHFG